MAEKNKTDTVSALAQYNEFDLNTQYLVSSFLQMAAAMIINIKSDIAVQDRMRESENGTNN